MTSGRDAGRRARDKVAADRDTRQGTPTAQRPGAYCGGGSNRNGARLILAEVQREHGQKAVDAIIREFDLATLFGFEPGTVFRGP